MTEWVIRDSRASEYVLHPSTQLALEALRALKEGHSFTGVLDMGCGSGLLSLAASEYWPQASILATDISKKAVSDAETNAFQYGLQARLSVLRADGFAHPRIRASAPYGLILCNLLAEQLVRYAPELKAHLAPGGYGVLSGILAWMYPNVMEVYESLGFEIAAEMQLEEWRCLVVQRRDMTIE